RVSYSVNLYNQPSGVIFLIEGSKILQNSTTRLSQLAILPCINSTSTFKFLCSTLSITSRRIKVLSCFRSTTNPVSGSGKPLTVTINSKLCPCQLTFAQGPKTSLFFSSVHLGFQSLCAALKCSFLLMCIITFTLSAAKLHKKRERKDHTFKMLASAIA